MFVTRTVSIYLHTWSMLQSAYAHTPVLQPSQDLRFCSITRIQLLAMDCIGDSIPSLPQRKLCVIYLLTSALVLKSERLLLDVHSVVALPAFMTSRNIQKTEGHHQTKNAKCIV